MKRACDMPPEATSQRRSYPIANVIFSLIAVIPFVVHFLLWRFTNFGYAVPLLAFVVLLVSPMACAACFVCFSKNKSLLVKIWFAALGVGNAAYFLRLVASFLGY